MTATTNSVTTNPANGLTYTHLADSTFSTTGLRSFFSYRDLGINAATHGAVTAHVIRAVPGADASGVPHKHTTTFQMVYVLQGWVDFLYEGEDKVVRLAKGSCVYQPPGIRHKEVAHSDDVEMLEIVMPGNFGTEEVKGLH